VYGDRRRSTSLGGRGRVLVRALLSAAVLFPVPASLAAQTAETVDAWGVPARPVIAFGEVVGINLLTWSLNYYVRDADFAVVYPKTWWNNISNGFEYDGNLFATNMIDHPYHGTFYYNASRSNGIGFWGSVPFTFAGSFMWECCGERHPMALNDLVNTTLGGVALGEALHRSSSAVLSNEASGADRFGREVAAFVMNPVRGFNRLISGRAFVHAPNPADPDDRTPGFFRLSFDSGYREVRPDAPERSPVEGVFLNMSIDFGDPFRGRRRGAFDVFEFDLTMYGGDQNVIGSLAVRGNLLTRDWKRGGASDHVWAVVQSYEYDDTSAYQFGSQNVGMRLESLWPLGSTGDLTTRVQGGLILFGTLDSALRPATATPGGWDLRSFDYTTGLDGRVEAEARVGPARAIASWRASWMRSVNDSPTNGGGARHLIHMGKLTGGVRLTPSLGVAADFRVYLRDSEYDIGWFEKVQETAPELRLYGTWILVPGRNGAPPGLN
jgi:hypothetical protein